MLINRYKHSSFPKALARDLAYIARYCYLFFRNGFRNKTVLFYPDMPYRISAMYEIMMNTNYNMTNNPNQKFDFVVNWEDTTIRRHDTFIRDLSKKMRVINYRCADISKEKVEEIFADVFGYSSFVDPLTFHGECVEKSIMNGLHDGKTVLCPIMKKKPGYIYQKLINNLTVEGLVMNYRVAVFGDTIPFITFRYKPLAERFDVTEQARLANLNEEFSADEIAKILEFSRRLGMEYGELDIMRDQDDGRLYILDANNTPTIGRLRNSIDINPDERKYILKKSAKVFQETFLTDKKTKKGVSV